MKKSTLMLAVMLASGSLNASLAQADDFSKVFKEGKLLGDFRLRYEQNDTDNNLKTADALTLRSRLGLQSGVFNGFSALVEGSNTAAIIDDYAPENTQYNDVGDPTDTSLNRLQLNYTSADFNAVLGRQRIILDNARMVGNVGWRQQEQVYDAARFAYQYEQVKLDYSFINKVHTPAFVHNAAAHHLINLNYSGLGFASLSGYAYLLKDKAAPSNAQKNHTYGVRMAGKHALEGYSVLYSAEYAYQKTDDHTANYFFAEGGVLVSGITAALGYERLGSDDQQYGFQTPLATKHAFNGWADQFVKTPITGLDDVYFKVGGKLAEVQWLAFYHDYRGAKGGHDYGNEVDLQLSYDFAKYYSIGAKYATYSKGDIGKDVDKLWAWLEVKF